MAGGADGSQTKKLDQTPTWAVATVCSMFIIISLLLEKFLHKIGTWLAGRQKKALYEALDKVKSELMILGFISLLLTFGQDYIAKICVPKRIANTMLPCPHHGDKDASPSGRRLLWYERRYLAAGSVVKCGHGKEQLISTVGLHQLHILIFFLAVFHVFHSAVTMTLGRLKIRGWKKWEEEISSHDYEFSNDPSRFRLTHETSFVRAHSSFWIRMPFLFNIGCFFRQFFKSVGKADYMTLRNGFVTAHLAPGSNFDFRKYVKRSLEDDFKVIVGVSPTLWACFVLSLLLDFQAWHLVFWASLIPVIVILAVGTKLQAILTRMALEIVERHAVVQGIPLVQGSDKYFWFGRPHLILQLIHFALFLNAFQITYFLWIWYIDKLKSCFHGNFAMVIVKLCLGFSALFLCSYITLPLYALVTQMGSSMKRSIFDEHTAKALKKWHRAVKDKQRLGRGGKSPARATLGGSTAPNPSAVQLSGHTLHRFKTTGHSTRSYAYNDDEASDHEANLIVRVDDHEDDDNDHHPAVMSHHHHGEGTGDGEGDFSFPVKPGPQ